MTTASTANTVGGRPRSRAKKACKACNSRRVRCNVMEENPCKNCKSADVPCELMKSRRGKYERHPQSRAAHNQKPPSSSAASQPLQSSYEHSSPGKNENTSRSRSLSREQADSRPDSAVGETITSIFHIAPASTTPSSTAVNGADSTVFLGESSSISIVHGPQTPSATNHASPAEKTRLRYPIPDAVSIKTSTTQFESRRKAARIEYLRKDGAFRYPPNDVCEALMGAYFEWFHPCFPILDRHTFFNSYMAKTVSPLLLQAVLFVGATHCNEKVMKDLGFISRQDTRNEMYNHIKDIYDADYESDKVTVCQALLLMSFWRAGPLLEKDTRHWLGAAISLAQGKGMHRSSSTTTFSDGKLRKRIWWSLYVRDRQCSVALGLPTRIRDEDCDIEMLESSDFEEDHGEYPKFLGNPKKEHVLFAIQMAKLAILLGKIVLREFAPTNLPKKDSERSQLRDDLVKWESELSPEMAANATADSFWASMLHLSYNNLYILLYRSAYLAENDDQGAGNVALQAACRNTRITEDVLAQDLVQHLNVHITTSLFNSLCIHTVCLRRSQNATRKVAEYRAQLCLLGLRELAKTWDVTNWVLQLFLQFLDQSTAKRLQLVADSEDNAPVQQSAVGSASSPRTANTSDFNMDFGVSGSSGGQVLTRGDDFNTPGLDFTSHLFETKELQDFAEFQLQPDLFGGDVFGSGLDQYYSSLLPRGEDGLNDVGFR